ncbi:MAG: hypothetical protein QG589_372 [Patescibacteria group bacterium]|nr:hypothetical protein [Patescibacteria group bacterium]
MGGNGEWINILKICEVQIQHIQKIDKIIIRNIILSMTTYTMVVRN